MEVGERREHYRVDNKLLIGFQLPPERGHTSYYVFLVCHKHIRQPVSPEGGWVKQFCCYGIGVLTEFRDARAGPGTRSGEDEKECRCVRPRVMP